MLQPISPYRSIQQKHLEAPLLTERDLFLTHLESLGAGHRELSMKAAYLRHIVRIMRCDSHTMTMDEIKLAAQVWASDNGPSRRAKKNHGSPVYFERVASQWFRFLGRLPDTPKLGFDALLNKFGSDMVKIKGLSPKTIEGYRFRLSFFLKWLGTERHGSLSALCLKDVDDFIALQRRRGWSMSTTASYCQSFRTFFRYAEGRGYCASGLSAGIQSPRVTKYRSGHIAPTWSEVSKLLRAVNGRSASDLRAKAVILLFVVYGLRNSEVCDLRLSDFDWRKETFGVRRAKRGGMQQYPIQFEVGEAILRYLQVARPRTLCRHLFVRSFRPFGPMTTRAMWEIVGSRMRDAQVTSDHIGPHALRHACASRLLQKNVSILDIADFLGHRNARCVDIYARYDSQRLKRIAAFSLRGVM